MQTMTVLAPLELKKMLEPPQGRIDMVLDTDAFNEVDDQFAIAYAFLSPEKIDVKAVYAAPFLNERSVSPKDGMEKSYNEILRILDFLGPDGSATVKKGSENFLQSKSVPVESPAVYDLIQRAKGYSSERPLYVAAIGAITNIASAIIMAPEILDKIVIVWLGGHAHHMPHTREFNMKGDILAAQTVFDSGAALVQLPCVDVVSELYVTAGNMSELHGKSVLGAYLADIVTDYISRSAEDTKVIWDVSAIAWLVNPAWVETSLVPCPYITDELKYEFDDSRHMIRVANRVLRQEIFSDLFGKISKAR